MGNVNLGADILLRQGLRPGEWRLHSQVVESMWQKYGQVEVDLFASEETTNCTIWFALTPQAPLRLDAFPLISLLPVVLARGLPGPSPPSPSCSVLASPSMFLEPDFSPR